MEDTKKMLFKNIFSFLKTKKYFNNQLLNKENYIMLTF